MFRPRQARLKNRNSAFTLVELLIVMGVLVLLAAVTLPSVKELLKDQKSSQAARLVQAYAEGARARAIATGRPVAMVLERQTNELVGNDTCTRLSLGEVFPPYEGDWSDSRATIGGVAGNRGPIPGTGSRGTAFAAIPFSEAASLWNVDDGAPSGLVNPGDIIMFGDSPQAFRINSPVTYDANTLTLSIFFDNPPFDEDAGVVLGEPTVFPPVPVRYRIFRKPSKSLAGSVALPRGICIDLSCSGVGPNGLHFGTYGIAGQTRLGDPPVVQEFGEYGTVFIVFDPAGKVQDLYYALTPFVPSDTSGATANLLVHRPANNSIHLLVGKTQQVFPGHPNSLSLDVIPAFPGTASTRDDVNYNLLDPANYWVKINPFSGAITASQVQAQTTFAPLPTGLTPVEILAERVSRARALAISGTQRQDP